MKSGFALINKPAGPTSSDMVARVRRCFPKGTRVGHMGTLDPAAAGVLPIGVGKAARLFDYVVDKDKEYIAEMTLGITTDTQDATGTVLKRREARVSRKDLEAAFLDFTGEILQTPPAYSAVKKDGRRLYSIAREGGDASVPARTARIDAIELLAFRRNTALLRVVCGRGVYIRTLLHDIGETLGCGAHMAFLTRTRTGPFGVASAVSPDAFRASAQRGEAALLPMDAPLLHIPALRLDGRMRGDVLSGRALTAGLAPDAEQGGFLRIYLSGVFAGIACREGGLLKWKAMLLEDSV